MLTKLWIIAFACMMGCSMIMDNKAEQERMQQQMQALENRSKGLEQENQELKQRNQKLALTGKEVLNRLTTMQQKYAQISEENQDLSKQNLELLKKQHETWLKDREIGQQQDTTARKVFDEQIKTWERDNHQAEKIFEESGSLKKSSAQTTTTDDETMDSYAPKESPDIELPWESEIPTKSIDSTDSTASDLSTSAEQLVSKLAIKRQKLIVQDKWTLEQDEARFKSLISRLRNTSLPTTEKQKTIQDGLKFDTELSERLQRS